MKQFKIGLPILAFVLAVATSAFTAPTDVQRWHLIANKTSSEIFMSSSYAQGPSTESCDDVQELPCEIQFNTTQYANLQEYLDSFNDDEAALLADAVEVRSN